MGASKTYMGKPGWQGNNTGRGKEQPYTKTPITRFEGTHMNSETTRGKTNGGGKSGTFSGPKKRKPADSGY